MGTTLGSSVKVKAGTATGFLAGADKIVMESLKNATNTDEMIGQQPLENVLAESVKSQTHSNTKKGRSMNGCLSPA